MDAEQVVVSTRRRTKNIRERHHHHRHLGPGLSLVATSLLLLCGAPIITLNEIIIRPVLVSASNRCAPAKLPLARGAPSWRRRGSFLAFPPTSFLAPTQPRRWRRPAPPPAPPRFYAATGGCSGVGGGGAMKMSTSEGDGHPRPRPPPPLIDADCNLLHVDMLNVARGGLFASTSTTTDDGGQGGEDYEEEEDVVELMSNLLDHPSVRDANVVATFSPSSTVDESVRSVDIFSRYDGKGRGGSRVRVKTSVGVHPYHAGEEGDPTSKKVDRLSEMLEGGNSSGTIIACVGECGLDYTDGFPPPHVQRPWFDVQLDLACQYDLPVFLHERMAFDDTITAIESAEGRNGGRKLPPVLVHCFTGTVEECRAYVERGYYVGVTGYVLKSGDGPEEVRRCLESGAIPLDRLVIETDAPYMGFPDCRRSYLEYEQEELAKLNGKRKKRIARGIYPNVLGSLPMVLTGVTDAINAGRVERGEAELTEDEVGRACTRNAVEFFGFDVDL